MRTDFHTHVKLTQSVPFSREYTEFMFRGAKQAGLDAICLTEHYGSSQLNLVYKYVQSLEKQGDCFLFEGLKIFTGLEIDIAESGHILVIGPIKDILSIYSELEDRAKKKDHLPFDQLIKVIKHPSLLIGGGHPFRDVKGCTLKLYEHQIEQLEFLELNGRDLAHNKEYTETQIYALSKKLGLYVVAGSDTHLAFQYGCVCTKFHKEHTKIDVLKQAIAQNQFTIEYSEFAVKQVPMASKMKKALKKIHDLGGDYVSVYID